MKKLLALAVVCLIALPASADVFIPGQFNGWDNTIPMTETSAGSGVWTYDIPVQGANERMPFLFLSEAGNWDSKYIPSGDQWAYTDDTGNLTITFDTNAQGDGWIPDANRVGVSNEQGNWTAVGDWQGWDNANPATAMTDMGGGIYMYEATGLSEGEHFYKAVRTGSWDAIGADSRSVNADNYAFTVPAGLDTALMYVDALNGTIKVEVIPEPASLALLALGGLALIRRR